MPRPKVRLNIPEPSLRPVASPVDTFYQPQPPIPDDAVDNRWLGLAKAMEALSPSLEGFMKAVEKQKKAKVPGAALAAKEAFFEDVSEEELKKRWKKTIQQDPQGPKSAKRVPGPAFPPQEPPVFDLEAEKSKYYQERLQLTKRFANMTHAESRAFLEENQKLFPGVALNYAARPDFILNLKAQLGGSWISNANVFDDGEGNLTTYEVARSRRINEQARSEDPQAWLREFEKPLAEGLDRTKGQQFLLGALEVLSPIRNRYHNVVEGRALALRQEDMENVLGQGLFTAGISSNWMLPAAQEPILPTDSPDVRKEKESKNQLASSAAIAGWEEFKNKFYAIGAMPGITGTKARTIQFNAIQVLAEYYQDVDEYQSDQFLDKIAALPDSFDDSGTGTLGKSGWWTGRLTGLRDSLESRAAAKKRQGKPKDWTGAKRLGQADILNALAAFEKKREEGFDTILKGADPLTFDPEGDRPGNAQEWRTWIQDQPGLIEKLQKRLIESGYPEQQAADVASQYIRELANDRAQDSASYGEALSSEQQTEIEDIKLSALLHGNSPALLERIANSSLPPKEQRTLLEYLKSPEIEGVKELDYSRRSADIREGLMGIFGPDVGLTTATRETRNAMVNEWMFEFENRWKSADIKGKQSLTTGFLIEKRKLANDNKTPEGGKVDAILKDAEVRKPDKLVQSFADEDLKDAHRFIANAVQDTMVSRNAEGEIEVDLNNTPILVNDPEAPFKRAEAQQQYDLLFEGRVKAILDIATRMNLPDFQDPSDVTIWGPRLMQIVKRGGPVPIKGFPETFRNPGHIELLRQALGRSEIVPDAKKVTAGEPTAKPTAEEVALTQQVDTQQTSSYEGKLSYEVVNGGKEPKRPRDADELKELGYSTSVQSLLSNQSDAAYQAQPGRPRGEGFKEYQYNAQVMLTSRDEYMGAITGARYKGDLIHLDNASMPTENGSNIFWLSSFLQGQTPGTESFWDSDDIFDFFAVKGDWHYYNGKTLYGEGATAGNERWANQLKGEVLTRGLWLEEILLGQTREGVSLEMLGWGDPKNIPWANTIIGKANDDTWVTEMQHLLKDGKLTEGWENSPLGQVLMMIGIDPSKEDKRLLKGEKGSEIHETQWDGFLSIQSGLRNLRQEVLEDVVRRDVHWEDLVSRGLVRSLGRNRDAYPHEIPRLNTSISSPQEFLRLQGQGPKGTLSGNSEWRMFSPLYAAAVGRSEAFQKAAEALNQPKSKGLIPGDPSIPTVNIPFWTPNKQRKK